MNYSTQNSIDSIVWPEHVLDTIPTYLDDNAASLLLSLNWSDTLGIPISTPVPTTTSACPSPFFDFIIPPSIPYNGNTCLPDLSKKVPTPNLFNFLSLDQYITHSQPSSSTFENVLPLSPPLSPVDVFLNPGTSGKEDGNSNITSKNECLQCVNCKTTETAMWRKLDNRVLCNACGLYERLKKTPRPQQLAQRKIRYRKSRRSSPHSMPYNQPNLVPLLPVQYGSQLMNYSSFN